MKNDTIITPRLDSILDALVKGPLSRLMLEQNLRINRLTLLRDLTKLINLGKVETLGAGRSTLYILCNYNPLLTPPTPRSLNKEVHFNSNVLDHLHNLLTPLEKDTDYLRFLSKSTNILGPIIASKEKERLIIDFSWKSSAIEGNTYTLPETLTLLTTGSPSPTKTSYETQMILNHDKAVRYVWDHIPKHHELTLDYILSLHTMLTDGLNVKPGIRTLPVGISGSIYLPPNNPQIISLALEQTINIINKTKHPLEQTLIAVAMLSYIQPFMDGNKRTARLVGNALLLSNDLIPISYRTTIEEAYRDALLLFYEQNSLVAFKNILLEQLHFSHTHYFRTE